jgi:hypothetical protein
MKMHTLPIDDLILMRCHADPMTKGLTGNKFNARAVRSFAYLEARAKRLEGIIAQLQEQGAKTIDVNISPRGPLGEMGPPGECEYLSAVCLFTILTSDG